MATVIRGDDNFDTAENGRVVQVVNFQTGAVATGTTTIPVNDTIPQITEGTEFMTLAITPTSATNKLLIEISVQLSHTVVSSNAAALFVGTTANALCTMELLKPAQNRARYTFSHVVAAGVTTELTFRLRAGGSASGTTTLNGRNGVREYGGSHNSSMTITEYEP